MTRLLSTVLVMLFGGVAAAQSPNRRRDVPAACESPPRRRRLPQTIRTRAVTEADEALAHAHALRGGARPVGCASGDSPRARASAREDPRAPRRVHRERYDAEKRSSAVAHAGLHRRRRHDLRGRLLDRADRRPPGRREDRDLASLLVSRGDRGGDAGGARLGRDVGLDARGAVADPTRVRRPGDRSRRRVEPGRSDKDAGRCLR